MAGKRPVPFTAKLAAWRLWIQAAFLAVWMAPWQAHTVCSPVFHCYSCPLATFSCPIGALAQFSAAHAFPFLAVGTLIVFGAAVGTLICGWVCPFGFLQDLVGRLPTPKFNPPVWMTHFRYLVLIGLVLAVPYFFGKDNPLFICRVCPAGAVEAAVPYTVSTMLGGDEIVWPSALKITVLVLFVGSMLFMWRPWCTLFCPLGAIFSLFNRTSIVFLRFHPSECKDCSLCKKLCNYGGRSEGRAGDMQCIRCLDCTRCDAISVDTIVTLPDRPQGESEAEKEETTV